MSSPRDPLLALQPMRADRKRPARPFPAGVMSAVFPASRDSALAGPLRTARERLESLGLPHKSQPAFRQLGDRDWAGLFAGLGTAAGSASKWTAEAVQTALGSVDWTGWLVFDDTGFRGDLSETGGQKLAIGSLEQALRQGRLHPDALEMRLTIDDDTLGLWTFLAARHHAWLEVPTEALFAGPVAILPPPSHLPVPWHCTLQVRAGAAAQFAVLQPRLVSLHAFLSTGAGLDYLELGSGEGERHTHLFLSQDKDSRFDGRLVQAGGGVARTALTAELSGEGASFRLDAAGAAAGSERVYMQARVHHLAPACTSRQRFHLALRDRGRTGVHSTVLVHPHTQRTDARQLIRNLLLSDGVRAEASPELVIRADDVKCSHGATSGSLDAEELFYLQSRGLEPALARSLLVASFFDPLLPQSPALRERLRETLLHPLQS